MLTVNQHTGTRAWFPSFPEALQGQAPAQGHQEALKAALVRTGQ